MTDQVGIIDTEVGGNVYGDLYDTVESTAHPHRTTKPSLLPSHLKFPAHPSPRSLFVELSRSPIRPYSSVHSGLIRGLCTISLCMPGSRLTAATNWALSIGFSVLRQVSPHAHMTATLRATVERERQPTLSARTPIPRSVSDSTSCR